MPPNDLTTTEIIRCNSRPLNPLPTDAAPRLPDLPNIRAVLFDVYGTLFISASGDISLTSGASRGSAAEEALAAVGAICAQDAGGKVVTTLTAEIKRQHQASAFTFPEVDIHQVWHKTLERLRESGFIDSSLDEQQVERLAVEYETRVNPVWPMPGLVECLTAIQQASLQLGIVSNAQAFTRDLFAALADRSLCEIGFDEKLCAWSYQDLQAKPGRWLYDKVAGELDQRGIAPVDVLYVGNDMRNDIAPAAVVGFRTVLFAGDARSLRLREGDPLVVGVEPDGVVTDLRQILQILRLAPAP